MFDQLYSELSKLLEDVLPQQSHYVFQKERELDTEYKFLLLIDEDLSKLKFFKKNLLVTTILDVFNLDISKYKKKVTIEVEVYDEFR
ncbi:hypothetical protein SHELI_v1c02900 [Spiroplasma helicoides]|uniref:Uncharacterized protein n=1 Tax=Spiroplasma helicoides TaxID=216938 RepID=A0A1B3SJZ3_9MOLU|nr:hypothetical protein [Spiroplasma helicoides]AOG60245.1 hypothetical protein SHELI_v1c02900 [Spiroplasma helicoides]